MNLHFLFLMCTLLAGDSLATSFYIRPFEEFTRDSHNIVRGRLHQPHSEFGITSSGERNVHTYAEIEVLEVLKGRITGSSIQVRKLGGTKDGTTLHIPGSPEFQDGEVSVFFLGPENEDHSYEVTGLELGKFGLSDKSGETELTGGLFTFSNGPEAREAIGPGVAENKRVWTLKQLKELIAIQKEASPPPANASPGPKDQRPPVRAESSAKPDESPAPGASPSLHDQVRNDSPAGSSDPAKIAGILFLFGGALLAIFFYLRRK